MGFAGRDWQFYTFPDVCLVGFPFPCFLVGLFRCSSIGPRFIWTFNEIILIEYIILYRYINVSGFLSHSLNIQKTLNITFQMSGQQIISIWQVKLMHNSGHEFLKLSIKWKKKKDCFYKLALKELVLFPQMWHKNKTIGKYFHRFERFWAL